MIPDFEKMNERMEQASLKELMPDFDKDQEWMQLSQKLHPLTQRKFIPAWSYAAAILLLLAGGIGLTKFISDSNNPPIIAAQPVAGTAWAKVILPDDTTLNTKPAIVSDVLDNEIKHNKNAVVKNTVALKKHRQGYNPVNSYKTKDIICNGTPCPIQICISQTMKCPNIPPATISSCSTLEPDQSQRLGYKAHDKIAKNCSLTVNEIEITNIATGETILLNASSSPSTAQDVFSYISGQKKGDILAGMFNSDCNHKPKKQNLRLNNSYGDLIIQ